MDNWRYCTCSNIVFIVGIRFDWDVEPICSLVLIFIVFGIGVGLLWPAKEYTEPVIKSEVELVTLNNNVSSQGFGGLFYVSVSTNNVYSYRYEVEDKYNLGGKAYETATLTNNVTEVESKECKKPVLKIVEYTSLKEDYVLRNNAEVYEQENIDSPIIVKYTAKPKKNFFTFGLRADDEMYKIYIPKGTIGIK